MIIGVAREGQRGYAPPQTLKKYSQFVLWEAFI